MASKNVPRAESRHLLDWLVGGATVLSLAVSVVALYYSGQQITLSRIQMKDSQDSEEMQHRAYLEVSMESASAPGERIISATGRIYNHGKTPARNLKAQSRYFVGRWPLGPSETPALLDANISTVVYPGSNTQIQAISVGLISPEDEMASNDFQSNKRKYIFVQLQYDDIFGKHHVTRYCSFLDPLVNTDMQTGRQTRHWNSLDRDCNSFD